MNKISLNNVNHLSLKTISMISPQLSSKILYPIDFQMNNIDQTSHKKQSHKVPTSDSGIVVDTTTNTKIEYRRSMYL